MRYIRRLPVDYSKCNQFVTVCHFENGAITYREIQYAFFDFRKNEIVNRTGQTESNGFLLVIPVGVNNLTEQPVYNGDKVVLGQADHSISWANLIPSLVPNMAVIKYVDPKYWKGAVIHWEAGG